MTISIAKASSHSINPYWKLSLVFKCLTDTIMLDDFKTELKKLGIARIERDEARRQSSALVTKDSCGGGHDEIENRSLENDLPDNLNLGEMLTCDDQSTGSEDRRKRPTTRHSLGRVGTKISRLPSLGQIKGHGDPWKNKEKV